MKDYVAASRHINPYSLNDGVIYLEGNWLGHERIIILVQI